MIRFVNNPSPELLKCYPPLIIGIKNVARDIYDEIIQNLNIPEIAEMANRLESSQFQQLARLLGAIGERRDEIIEKLDLAQLSKTASSVEVEQFQQLAVLLGAIGNRRDELIKELDLAQLSRTASSAEVEQFHQLAVLLGAIGNRRDELIRELKLVQLAEKANSAKVEQFSQLADLLGAIRNRRDELIKKLDLAQLSRTANSAEIGQFDQLAYLLVAIGDLRDEIIEKLNFVALAKVANSANVKEFGEIAKLLVALSDNRNKLIEKMDLELLAKTCNDTHVEVKQFKSLAQVLRELEESRNELIKELDFGKLAKAANAADIAQFDQIAELLRELGQSKIQLSKLLDHNTLIQRAQRSNQTGPHDIIRLTRLMAELEEENRSKYIREVDWISICLKCPIYMQLLSPLGASLKNLWKQDEISPNRANIEKVTQHLRDHANKIKEEIRNVRPKFYSGVANFLWSCNQFDPELAKRIATETIDKLVETFKIEPTEYQGAGRLINAIYAIDPNLSASFVIDNRVKGKIQQSINELGWNKELEGLKHLIEAFYRSTPDLWKKMVICKWITVDLSSLDLDSIYDKVDKEKNVGTLYDIL